MGPRNVNGSAAETARERAYVEKLGEENEPEVQESEMNDGSRHAACKKHIGEPCEVRISQKEREFQ